MPHMVPPVDEFELRLWSRIQSRQSLIYQRRPFNLEEKKVPLRNGGFHPEFTIPHSEARR